MRTLGSTPAADGFRMPAEWERHDGCWMVWPQNDTCRAKAPAPPSARWPALPTPSGHRGSVTVTVTGDQYAHARSSLDSRSGS